MRLYGKDWKKIPAHVQTRTAAQIRNHLTNFRKHCLANPELEGADIVKILDGK